LLKFASQIIAKYGETTKNMEKMLKAFSTGSNSTAELLESAVRSSITPTELLEFFNSPDGYEVDRVPTAQTSAQALTRGTAVIGRMLENIGNQYQNEGAKNFATWLTRAGRALWRIVEVAMPLSFFRLLFGHWLAMVYAFGVMLIVASWATANEGAYKLGGIILGVTVSLNVLWWFLSDLFTRRLGASRGLKVGAILLIAGLVAVGAHTVSQLPLGVDELRAWTCKWLGWPC